MPIKQADLARIEALMKKWRQEDPAGFDAAVKRVESIPLPSTGSEKIGNEDVSPLDIHSPVRGVNVANEDAIRYGMSESNPLEIQDGDDEQSKLLKDIIARHFDEYDDVFKALA
ncbi:MAG: hypothetical protein AAGF87_08130 [Bacteroidota bacterium]